MKELKFKTTLKCGGCEEKVTPGLNAIEAIKEWNVDLESTQKTLTVKADKDVSKEVKAAVEKVGFEIEVI
ncbi:heavy metal-associated protein [Brumimicrobium salinarum]|uniref:Heavy metal-associated protein n=1 Tax=Brumimicrobium salinarum TaxID=2058658 RepID=A0A2I0R0Y8_9FLAO|nr:heavy-metal-associated domain-containing protein [Brumimicrobium salinarum]PKR80229.1 heavy metal-associated protein [Brumimicrobium salinarum]